MRMRGAYFIIWYLDWLDKGLPPNEEGRETVHEDDGATNRRVTRRTSNATQEQERDIDSHHKCKTPKTIYSSSSSDDGDKCILLVDLI